MYWLRKGVLAIGIVALVSCIGQVRGIASALNLSHSVSMVNLLASPDKYDGQFIIVGGYLKNDFENRGLYLSKDLADNHLSENALSLSTPLDEGGRMQSINADIERLRDRYVTMQGRYRAPENGTVPPFGGSISEITNIVDIQSSLNLASPRKPRQP